MPPAPPSPADQALAQVLRVSRANGWSILCLAAAGALLSLGLGDWSGAVAGMLAAAAGGLELRGHDRLRRRDPAGVALLARAELLLLTVIAAYCTHRLLRFDAGALRTQFIPELQRSLRAAGFELTDLLRQQGLTLDDLVLLIRRFSTLLYSGVLLLSVLYQGGLAWWYHRRAALVAEAFATPPRL